MTMTPVEKLEAAVARLEQLDGYSTPAAWTVSDELWDGSNRWEIDGVTSDGDGIGSFVNRADALLVETLHRTIDAQIAMLRATIEAVQETRGAMSWEGPGFTLADAILGGDSNG